MNGYEHSAREALNTIGACLGSDSISRYEQGLKAVEDVEYALERLIAERDQAVSAFNEVAAKCDSWEKVAREYETALSDRGLL